MFRASRYWRFVRIDATSRCIVQELQPVKLFYEQLFAELPEQIKMQRIQDVAFSQLLWLKWHSVLRHTQLAQERAVNLWFTSLAYHLAYLLIVSKLEQWLQRQLLALQQDESLPLEDRFSAELSLRCYISEQIRSACVALGAQFGSRHGFVWYELLRFVMDDTDPTRSICFPYQAREVRSRSDPPAETYEYLPARILRTFEPDRSSLATWTSMLVRQSKPLKAFLLEHGVYLISDWALLNDTEPETLRCILSQTYSFPTAQVEQACAQLNSYHEVYRNPYRRSRTRGGCQPPTLEQLTQMIDKANLSITPKQLMQSLLELAGHLRQYRVFRKGGPIPADSIDVLEEGALLPRQLSVAASDSDAGGEDDQTMFLNRYRQQFIASLDQAISDQIQQYSEHLQRRSSTAAKAKVLLQVLQRYYCDRVPMSTIANEVGFKGQFEVTRLLKIKEFRSQVRQRTLKYLQGCILELAKEYIDPDRLQSLDQQVEAALGEYLDQVILESSVRSNSDQERLMQNIFVQRLCCVIQQLS